MASVAGMRRPPVTDVEPGEWAHGRQHHASSASEHHFRKVVVLRESCLPTRRIFGRTPVLGRPKSWSDAPPSLSSGLHQTSSERSSWRNSVCRCLFLKSGASVDCWSTVTDGTERHAPTQAGCTHEPQHQNAHSPVCAGRPERQFASTRRWWT